MRAAPPSFLIRVRVRFVCSSPAIFPQRDSFQQELPEKWRKFHVPKAAYAPTRPTQIPVTPAGQVYNPAICSWELPQGQGADFAGS